MAPATQKTTKSFKGRSIEITRGEREEVRVESHAVQFTKSKGKYYTPLLPYAEYKDLDTLAKAVIDVYPTFGVKPQSPPKKKK